MPLPFEWGTNLRHEVPAAPFIKAGAALALPAQQIPAPPALPHQIHENHREPELQQGSSRTTHSPSLSPGCLNHPQAVESHTSEDEKVQVIPTGGLHKGGDESTEHHNARIQQQQNSIEASQHKNPHCPFDFQPSQLWAAKNHRINHSLLPSYPKSNLGVSVLIQRHINCCEGTKYYLE